MLAKVITLKHSAAGKGFEDVLRYVLRASRDSTLPEGQILECGHLNIDNDALFWDDPGDNAETRGAYAIALASVCDAKADACRDKGRFNGNPVYHVAINWQEGEHPTPQQAEHACRHVMKELGYGDHEAVWAIHRDTDNDHVHLVINRVHPDRLNAISPPFKKDYFILDRCMRELEIEFGHQRANGPFITLDSAAGPKIVRMSRAERRERGLLKEDGPRLSERARRAEINLGAEQSFQTWVAEAPAGDLRKTLDQPGVTWTDVHATLATHGVAMQAKGSGLVVTTQLPDGRTLAAKASQLGRWASKAELEKRLGPFVPPQTPLDPPQHYAAHVEATRRQPRTGELSRGALANPAETPGSPWPSRDPDTRAVRRAERAQARAALADRFKAEQESIRQNKPRYRAELREQHQRERSALQAEQRKGRAQIYAESRKAGQPIAVAQSLWAWRAAQEREALQKRQAGERKALSAKLPRAEVWRKWLEHEAEQGDEAAQAALRGIRYREQRETKRQRDGIEGEELDPLRKLVLAGLDAQIDQRRQQVIYRNAQGCEVFTDTGPRIEVHDKADDSLEAALRIAAQKYGGQVEITGSAAFREQAARQAAQLGIRVVDADLQIIVRDELQRGRPPRPGLSTTSVDETARKPGKSLNHQAPSDVPAPQAGREDDKSRPSDIERALDTWTRAATEAQRSKAAQQWMRAVENAQKAGESVAQINDTTRQRLGKGYGALMRQVGVEQERGR